MGRRLLIIVLSVAICALTTGCIAKRHPSKFGVNGDANGTAADYMKQAGFKWVRFFVGWDNMQPNGPWLDAGAFAYVNGMVNTYASRGFSIDIVFTRTTPNWAKDTSQSQPCASHPQQRRPKDEVVFRDFAFQMASQLKDRVAAWEVYNEPELDCRFPGSPADFRRLILGPGYDGIKAAQPDAVVLGPALAAPGQLDEWYTYPKDGKRYLKRPVAAANVHRYGDVATIKAAMNTANSWGRCMEDGSYCVSRYWFTEFGFNQSYPAGSANQIFEHCRAHARCERAFYFAANYETLSGAKVALLNPQTLLPRPMYWKLKEYILAREPALP